MPQTNFEASFANRVVCSCECGCALTVYALGEKRCASCREDVHRGRAEIPRWGAPPEAQGVDAQ